MTPMRNLVISFHHLLIVVPNTREHVSEELDQHAAPFQGLEYATVALLENQDCQDGQVKMGPCHPPDEKHRQRQPHGPHPDPHCCHRPMLPGHPSQSRCENIPQGLYHAICGFFFGLPLANDSHSFLEPIPIIRSHKTYQRG